MNKKLQPALLILALAISSTFNAQNPYDGQTMGTAGISALQILNDGYSVGDGVYWLDPDMDGGNPPFQAYCDMTTQGGGWTLGLKTWYGAGHYQNTNAVGTVSDALTLKGNPYKLSDQNIRDIIGPSNSFDVMATQTGYNSNYSTGNYEYVILNDYTGVWQWDQAMPASSTTTVLRSYRVSDDALAWEGELQYGVGGAGINGDVLLSGTNPAGGSGCNINMGTSSNSGWHHFYMAHSNSDSYLYICNGAQHSSSHNMNHVFWFRSNENQHTLSLNDNDIAPKIAVYPNPTNGVINIKGKGIELIEVKSILGKTLKQVEGPAEAIKIDLSNQAKGIYLIQVKTSKGSITRKIVLK